MKNAGRLPEGPPRDEPGHRQYAARSDQRPELQGGRHKRDEIDRGDPALQHEPAEPVLGCTEPVHARNSRVAAYPTQQTRNPFAARRSRSATMPTASATSGGSRISKSTPTI